MRDDLNQLVRRWRAGDSPAPGTGMWMWVDDKRIHGHARVLASAISDAGGLWIERWPVIPAQCEEPARIADGIGVSPKFGLIARCPDEDRERLRRWITARTAVPLHLIGIDEELAAPVWQGSDVWCTPQQVDGVLREIGHRIAVASISSAPGTRTLDGPGVLSAIDAIIGLAPGQQTAQALGDLHHAGWLAQSAPEYSTTERVPAGTAAYTAMMVELDQGVESIPPCEEEHNARIGLQRLKTKLMR